MNAAWTGQLLNGTVAQNPIALAIRPQRGLILGRHFNKANSRDEFEFMTGKLVVNVKQIGLPFKTHTVHDKT
jgi:hypothetical protein